MSARFTVVALLLTVGCSQPNAPTEAKPATPPAKAAPPATSTSEAPPKKATPEKENFEQLVDAAVRELQAKNESNTSWGLGSFDRWNVDQEKGVIVFSNDDGTTATAEIQVIGSFNTNAKTWLWAWDNPTIVDSLKGSAESLKEYGEKHDIERLRTPKWKSTEEEAWKMTALAAKMSNAQGAYRGPAGPSLVFMTFGEVTIERRPGKENETP